MESHNSLGKVERYHTYLLHIYEKWRIENSTMPTEILLRLAVNACNDTAGPSGLVPTILVFGVMLRLPVHPRELSEQNERMETLYEG